MTVNALESAFGELLHLNLIEEFHASRKAWTRKCLAAAYERALGNTMRDGAPAPPEGSLEAMILGLKVGGDPQRHPAAPRPAIEP